MFTDNMNSNWLITGVAGFIGSNILERLLLNNQKVTGLDNLSTGYMKNLEAVENIVGKDIFSSNFKFIKGDIRNLGDCEKACEGVDYVIHHAAQCSVPDSIENPSNNNDINVTGFLNIAQAAIQSNAKRMVYASSSAVYGDHEAAVQVEEKIGNPISPYGASKYINEIYASTFYNISDLEFCGLRYFNVFGPRQDPDGAYAAVIPIFFKQALSGNNAYINGDGEHTRDFIYIDNIVDANITAALSSESSGKVFNVGCGHSTSLNELWKNISEICLKKNPSLNPQVIHREERPGDIKHSRASIEKIMKTIGFKPEVSVTEGLEKAASWYMNEFSK